MQILASCEEFIDLLQRDEYDNISKMVTLFKKVMLTLLNKKVYNPLKFITLISIVIAELVTKLWYLIRE